MASPPAVAGSLQLSGEVIDAEFSCMASVSAPTRPAPPEVGHFERSAEEMGSPSDQRSSMPEGARHGPVLTIG